MEMEQSVQTKRFFKVRLSEHWSSYVNATIRAIELWWKTLSFISALVLHSTKKSHIFDFDKASILCIEIHPVKKNVLETIRICLYETVNFRSDVDDFISKIYHAILSDFKQ